ncbi:MAG: ATP phosphoribosyltransferase regulatory subunit [Clostridia bacterium]|nr:ATP phosphoribosyltransferase regulatory subunit [Clostridia bacterium]
MNLPDTVLENDEKAIFKLRNLYRSYGYSKYRMSKFEEYDFYVRNKDFLISDNIITFTDSDGKLMALKPDVTLSIIKNSKDIKGVVQKVYYNENVYRAAGDTKEVKEIMQVGLECIGDIDDYCISEAVLLAAKSLECIDEDYVLDISHMGVISEVLDYVGVTESSRRKLLRAFGEKNVQAVMAVCEEENLDDAKTQLLKTLVTIYGVPSQVLPRLKELSVSEGFLKAVGQLEEISGNLRENGCEENSRIDFSVANNMNYYSGVAFKGFINGIPGGVLSGGQYDRLMSKLKRKSGAIGFAVYLDMLQWLEKSAAEFDADIVLLYDEGEELCRISKAVKELSEGGKSVMAQRILPEKIRYKKLMKLEKGWVKTLEDNA